MNTVFQKPTKVLAITINDKGKNIVFDSIRQTCEYFNELGGDLYPQQLLRLLNGSGFWEYKEKENGKVIKTVQICFDELLENE